MSANSRSISIPRRGRRPKSSPISGRKLGVLPLSVNVGQPIAHRLDHMLTGIRSAIALKIFGDDLDTMRNTAEELRGKLAAIPGLADVQVEKQVLIPQLEIRVDYARAALYGVQPAAGDRSDQPALERARGVAHHRRLSPLRCGDAPAGRSCGPRKDWAIS